MAAALEAGLSFPLVKRGGVVITLGWKPNTSQKVPADICAVPRHPSCQDSVGLRFILSMIYTGRIIMQGRVIKDHGLLSAAVPFRVVRRVVHGVIRFSAALQGSSVELDGHRPMSIFVLATRFRRRRCLGPWLHRRTSSRGVR